MLEPYRRKVHYYETDRMGIVHHSNYARWFEEARLHYMDQVGLSYSAIEQWGLLSPVLFCNATFKVALHFPEEFSVDVRLKDFSGVRFTVDYQIYLETDFQRTLAAFGETGHCFVDAAMQPIRLKTTYPELYQRMRALLPAEETQERLEAAED